MGCTNSPPDERTAVTMIERERRGLADNGVRWSKTEMTDQQKGSE